MNVILIGLNEINFEYVKNYVAQGHLPTIGNLLQSGCLTSTTSEREYELWEPWIQWVTIHTGLPYEQHKVFRLGDIVDHPQIPQIFEILEKKGYTVAAVSPFNAENRLKNSPYFIPDPWTNTPASADKLLSSVFKAIKALVNSNASMKLSIRDLLPLFIAVLIYVPLTRWHHYIKYILQTRKPGIKALVMDSLLSDIFIKKFKSNRPDFSSLFLNAGAHIQHHFMFNSSVYNGKLANPEWYCKNTHDPLLHVLKEYDSTLKRLHRFPNVKIILATGLSQEPHDQITHYWRPKQHKNLMKVLGVSGIAQLEPRMSRDFLLRFENEETAAKAETVLESYLSNIGFEPIFKIDNRVNSLFVELIYCKDIGPNFSIQSTITSITIEDFKDHVAFVAIKNGEHVGTGYILSDSKLSPTDTIPLTEVKKIVEDLVIANKQNQPDSGKKRNLQDRS